MSPSSLPDHIQRPHIRRIHPIPGNDPQGRPIVQLRDPFMLTMDRILAIPMPAMQAVQRFDGNHDLEQVAEAVKRPVSDIQVLAQNMDNAGLLWGPTCERLEDELKQKLATDGHFPMRHSRTLGENADAARTKLRQWMHDTEDPEIEGTIHGLIVPRLDFNALWPVYAGAYHTVRNQNVDHIILLGCNQSGLGGGVVLTRYGFKSPLGISPPDTPVIDAFVDKLGDSILHDQLDHITEHGPEMQIPWIQECIGQQTPITAALIPDPLLPPDDDEQGSVSHEAFAQAAREIIADTEGETLVLAAVDLSSVGPQAGEPRPVDDQRRFDVERHDREMLGQFSSGDSTAFIEEARRTRNPTRWSGLGPMSMALDIIQPSEIELIDYRQMMLDEKGMAMITDASLTLA
ncbi:MAG: AmmeMemoRadiSam system protein B [Phycisphaerales bacterium]|nr:AmmeMemoRadiSam system protein B [Phycisphaerales bacterium]